MVLNLSMTFKKLHGKGETYWFIDKRDPSDILLLISQIFLEEAKNKNTFFGGKLCCLNKLLGIVSFVITPLEGRFLVFSR